MSLPVRFDERLLIDLSSIRAWYEAQQTGLGVRFVAAFYFSVNDAEIFLFLIFHGARNPRQLHRAILRRTP